MDDMVYNALRRKLAAAEAMGDLERIDRLRELMGVPAAVASEVPADVTEVGKLPSSTGYVTQFDVTDVDVEATPDPDW